MEQPQCMRVDTHSKLENWKRKTVGDCLSSFSKVCVCVCVSASLFVVFIEWVNEPGEGQTCHICNYYEHRLEKNRVKLSLAHRHGATDWQGVVKGSINQKKY